MNHQQSLVAQNDDWTSVVDRLPFVAAIRKDIGDLRHWTIGRREPRILLVGQPGPEVQQVANELLSADVFASGTSVSLEEAQWIKVSAAGRQLRLMYVNPSTPGEPWGALAPDVLVWVIGESTGVRQMDQFFAHYHRSFVNDPIPRFQIALTEADPSSPSTLVREIRQRLVNEKLGNVRIARITTRGTAPTVVDAASRSRGIAVLADAIFEELPAEARVEGARSLSVSDARRSEFAREVVRRFSTVAVTVGLAPIPFSDAFLLIPLQGTLITTLAYISGQPWDRKATLEWVSSLGVLGGAAFGLRWGAQQMVKLVPGAGALISGSVAGAGTMALGQSALAYFVDGPGRRRPQLKSDGTHRTPEAR